MLKKWKGKRGRRNWVQRQCQRKRHFSPATTRELPTKWNATTSRPANVARPGKISAYAKETKPSLSSFASGSSVPLLRKNVSDDSTRARLDGCANDNSSVWNDFRTSKRDDHVATLYNCKIIYTCICPHCLYI